MKIISDCVVCAVILLTLGDFLFALSVVLLTIKQEIEWWGGRSSLKPKEGLHLLSLPAPVPVREKPVSGNPR
jgi:hypothetical protein